MANSSSTFIQRLFIYRLMLIQFNFLIPIFPFDIDDWSLWSNMFNFRIDYIANTIASMSSTPFRLQHANLLYIPNLTLPGHTPLFKCMSPKIFKNCLKVLRKRHLYFLSQLITSAGSHLVSWDAYRSAYIAQLADKRGRALPHRWYLDIKANTTIPNSNDHLNDLYVSSPSSGPVVILTPGISTSRLNRNWIVTLDDNNNPICR